MWQRIVNLYVLVYPIVFIVCCQNKTPELETQKGNPAQRKAAGAELEKKATESEDLPTLKIGHVGHDHHTALYVAALEGRELDHEIGLWLKTIKYKKLYDLYDGNKKIAHIDLFKTGGGSKMPTMMSQGHFEMGLGGVAAIAFFVDKGSPIKIVSPLHTKGNLLVVEPKIPSGSWNEFLSWLRLQKEQVRIGYKNPVAVAKLIFERAMKEEKISFTGDKANYDARILLVHMKGEQNLVPGLQNGLIDGYVSNNPWCAIAQNKGVGKIVCELDDLPPGVWKNHPCCCVAATDALIRDPSKADIAAKLMALIIAATEKINRNPDLAYKRAAEWIGTTFEIERLSMQTSSYDTKPNEEWKAGIYTWASTMNEMGRFKGILKDKRQKEIDPLMFNFSLLEKAEAALSKRRSEKSE